MFVKNTGHLQTSLFGLRDSLPEAKRKKVLASKEYAIYQLVYLQINEEVFAPLFSETGSRPNAPVNALVTSMVMQQSNGWTGEELFRRIEFDILTRAALGLDSLDENPFCPATYYNFQNRLLHYHVATGINLIEQVFDSLTADQLKRLKIKTDIQRTDSTFLMSNIRNYSRLQLVIEVLLRLHRVLDEEDQLRFMEMLKPYTRKTSSNYVYSVERKDIPHELESLGRIYHQLHTSLKDSYANVEVFGIFTRVFEEHFHIVSEKVEVRPCDQLHSGCLQSPDDIDATYRNKDDTEAKGQLLNVVETANPENELDLLTDVSVFANNTDDGNNFNTRLDLLKEKTPELREVHTDGAYGNKNNDAKMEDLGIDHIQTAVKGRVAKVSIIIEDKTDEGYIISCPNQKVKSQPTRKRNKATFESAVCSRCKMSDDCPVAAKGKNYTYYFDESDYLVDKRNQRFNTLPADRKKIRSNVEATIKEFTKGYNHKGKLRVRGRFRSMLFAFTMAIAINVGRIHRYVLNTVIELGLCAENALSAVLQYCTAWVAGECRRIVCFLSIFILMKPLNVDICIFIE